MVIGFMFNPATLTTNHGFLNLTLVLLIHIRIPMVLLMNIKRILNYGGLIMDIRLIVKQILGIGIHLHPTLFLIGIKFLLLSGLVGWILKLKTYFEELLLIGCMQVDQHMITYVSIIKAQILGTYISIAHAALVLLP